MSQSRYQYQTPFMAFFFMLLGWVIIPTLASAAQTINAADNASISVNIASQAATRISVQDDRIRVMRGAENAYTYTHDNIQGAVFIKPTPDQQTPFYLFISTEQGRNYVLLLTPSAIPATLLILKPSVQKTAPSAGGEKSLPYPTQLSELIKQMISGEGLENYTLLSVANTPPMQPTAKHRHSWRLQLLTRYEGAQFIGEVYRIHNRSAQAIWLRATDFYQRGDRAIALTAFALPPRGVTLLYKVRSHD